MPSTPGSLYSDSSEQNTTPDMPEMGAVVPERRTWEAPTLRSISLDETESGFIYATKETTTPPTRVLVS